MNESRQATDEPNKGVYVIDPHPVTRRGLCAVIGREPGLILRGQAENLDEALTEMGKLELELTIVESCVAPEQENAMVSLLRRAAPHAKIVVLSVWNDPLHVRQVMAAGASGFISKGRSNSQVLQGFRRVLEGEQVILASSRQGGMT